MSLRALSYVIRQLTRMPHVTVSVGDDPASLEFYTFATNRHRRYFFIRNKSWGVAMLKLPDTFEEYLRGAGKTFLRHQQRLALSAGYYFDSITAVDHLDEILSIHSSRPVRQGQPISPAYLDRSELSKYFSGAAVVFAVRDRSGIVRAYAHTLMLGEVAIFDRLMGHGEHLKNGIMYLLVSEAVRAICERKAGFNSPQWVMYDMMLGAGEGLRFFKERLGFQPYYVSWRRPPSRCADCMRVDGEGH